MNKKQKALISLSTVFIILFIIWTVLVKFVDTAPIGPQRSSVGFSHLNEYIRNLIGVNMTLYKVTDWLGILPLLIASGFAVLGLTQLIARKRLFKVDKSILLLGVFYCSVIFVFFFFEKVIINYRPVLIDGILEGSYPSSTTLLFTTVMPTAILELSVRIKRGKTRVFILSVLAIITAFSVVGRIIAGVHWITDIIGGLFISAGLDLIYIAFRGISVKIEEKN